MLPQQDFTTAALTVLALVSAIGLVGSLGMSVAAYAFGRELKFVLQFGRWSEVPLKVFKKKRVLLKKIYWLTLRAPIVVHWVAVTLVVCAFLSAVALFLSFFLNNGELSWLPFMSVAGLLILAMAIDGQVKAFHDILHLRVVSFWGMYVNYEGHIGSRTQMNHIYPESDLKQDVAKARASADTGTLCAAAFCMLLFLEFTLFKLM